MGLFDKLLGKKEEPAKAPAKAEKELPELETTWVNITGKQLKIPVESKANGSAYIKGGYLWEEEKLIKLLDGNNEVIFEVTPRSKTFKELQPLTRTKLWDVTVYQKQGDYGEYFRVRIRKVKE